MALRVNSPPKGWSRAGKWIVHQHGGSLDRELTETGCIIFIGVVFFFDAGEAALESTYLC